MPFHWTHNSYCRAECRFPIAVHHFTSGYVLCMRYFARMNAAF